MPEPVAWSALVMGIVSACSLPLGALTIRFWRPDDRTIAVLMAFGGGALLAALTIDLVGAASTSASAGRNDQAAVPNQNAAFLPRNSS